ncbi:MAG: polyribonucleotide nucleotidyltransferase [Microgenomates group bacterium LiPW_31]|nr:MAG: polyribonucleotide nucleotidyltransferase [Microgenomates group bacterium LiPW_31]
MKKDTRKLSIVSKSVEIGNKTLTLETGRFAAQANSAVLARLGDTMVLSTVVSARPIEDLDYVPLSVEYLERLYAGGKIKGSRWVKREGRPSDEAILIARLVDRSVRPLFPEDYRNEVQVIITVLSVDAENNPDIPAVLATSAALAISDITWNGPVGVLRIGFVPKNGGESFIVNPTHQDLEYSEMDLVVAATRKTIIMIEGGLKEVSEEIMLKGVDFGQQELVKIIGLIEDLVKEVGLKKQKIPKEEVDTKLIDAVEKDAKDKVAELIGGEFFELKEALAERYNQEKKSVISKIVDNLVKKIVREKIIKKSSRPDGRKPQDIRPLTMEVGILPRTHGSAMFKRGNTQTLTVTTLGSPSLEQLIESMEGEETKRYIHHYYMPPFSLGEVGRLGWPSRREIGHGALAERALEPVIPSDDKFPYTIRVVSEIMSSNGSTSMAAVCGSTLSLMDAGVPIKAPVAGIAMGKVGGVILSDITGLEDFNGDMDFKIAGSKKGITAIQLDVKTLDLTKEILEKALNQAHKGRLFILDKMLQVLPASRAQISKFAPKIEVLHVPIEKIGEVIGPGGKIIRTIIQETGAMIDVEDDGTINVSALQKDSVDRAVAWIQGLTKEVKPGEIIEGVVKRIQPFGAFVEISPGKEGLVHVSKMAPGYVANPADIVKIGQKVKVKILEVDERGRINLSMILDE